MQSPVSPASPVELCLQPVVPLEFTVERLKPPMNDPQETPASLSSSPILFHYICSVALPEQTSPSGSGSLITLNDQLPPSVTTRDATSGQRFNAPTILRPDIF